MKARRAERKAFIDNQRAARRVKLVPESCTYAGETYLIKLLKYLR
jgi:hypothetical protein